MVRIISVEETYQLDLKEEAIVKEETKFPWKKSMR
jgi:hypothetical protein